MENGKTVDLSEGIGQELCKLKELYPDINLNNNGNHTGQFKNNPPEVDLYMYYGSKFSDVSKERQVTIKLETETGSIGAENPQAKGSSRQASVRIEHNAECRYKSQ